MSEHGGMFEPEDSPEYRPEGWNTYECPSSNEESDEDSLPSSDGSAGFLLDSEDSRSQSTGTTTPSIALPSSQPKLSKQDQARMLHLSLRVKRLYQNLNDKEQDLDRLRAQLDECIKTNKEIETSITNTKVVLFEEQKSGNSAAVGLLQGQLVRLQNELGAQIRLEEKLSGEIISAEVAVAEAKLTCSKYAEVQNELEKSEAVLKEMKHKQAMLRVQTQGRLLIEAQRSHLARERALEQQSREHKEESKAALLRAQQAMQDGRQFLKSTLARKKVEEEIEEETTREYLERRMKALLGLKGNIESNQSTLKAQQMLQHELTRQQRLQETRERQEITMRGGNPDVVMLKRKLTAKLETEKQKLAKQQKKRQVEIMSKLLEESRIHEQNEKKMSKSHWVSRSETKLATKQKGFLQARRTKKKRVAETEVKMTQGVVKEEEVNVPSHQPDTADTSSSDEMILEPEILGLWDDQQGQKQKHEAPKQSKMEKEMMEKALVKLKQTAVVKQVAAGREFTGTAFLSKPAEIVFKDFDVGCVYKKHVQLTNVSYTVNYCKLVGVSDNLKDFVTIQFTPPGSMSAGLTCQMIVVFEPLINRDIEGEVMMMSQTGPFSVPVKCITKKCLVSLDSDTLCFDSLYIGEVAVRTITLRNNGALSTGYRLKPTLISQSSVKSGKPEGGSEEDRNIMSADNNGSQHSIMSDIDFLTVAKADLSGVHPSMVRSTGSLSAISTTKLNIIVSDYSEKPSNELAKNSDDQGEENQDAAMRPVSSEPVSLPVVQSPIQIGQVSSGTVPAYSSSTVQLIFKPDKPGYFEEGFQITFSDPSVQPMVVTSSGKASALPLFVENEMIDLRICMLDRLYQESVIIHNRSNSSHKITCSVPELMADHIEVLPKQGLIQANSSFAVQLKFLPKPTIMADYQQYCPTADSETHLEIPVKILVADLVLPLGFSIQAVVTPSQISFSSPLVDCGSCSVQESVIATLDITNTACLPQDFGFVNLPKWLEIQPNDGFGTLLPHETVPLEVIFSPDKPRVYSAQITCKSGSDRNFQLTVQGQGVLPPLVFSENAVTFAATPVGGISEATIHITNPSLARLDSAVIRGAAPEQGLRAFEFQVPDGMPFSLSPHVGVVKPGKSVSIKVYFNSCLNRDEIAKEAARLTAVKLEEEQQQLQQAQEAAALLESEQTTQKNKRSRSNQPSRQGHKDTSMTSSTASSSKHDIPGLTAEYSSMWWKAHHNLLLTYQNKCYHCNIPCFVSSVTSTSTSSVVSSQYIMNLEVTGTTVRPALVLCASEGNRVEFGGVGLGDSKTKTIVLKNISSKPETITPSLLDTAGPFEIRNAIRTIPPQGTHNMILQFQPTVSKKELESLRLHYGTGYLELTLVGHGVDPVVQYMPKTDRLDYGHVLVGDTNTLSLQLRNKSEVKVKYLIELEAENQDDHTGRNLNGQPVFNCVPYSGSIDPGCAVDVSVSFSPDHPGRHFSALHVLVNSKRVHSVDLKGCAWSTNMYVLGGEDPGAVESCMTAVPDRDSQTETLMILLRHSISNTRTASSSCQLEIGCIKSLSVKKASGEFVIDPLQPASDAAKCFTIDTLKATIEGGVSRQVTVTFKAPTDQASSDANFKSIMEASTNLVLKGDTTHQHRLLLRGILCD